MAKESEIVGKLLGNDPHFNKVYEAYEKHLNDWSESIHNPEYGELGQELLLAYEIDLQDRGIRDPEEVTIYPVQEATYLGVKVGYVLYDKGQFLGTSYELPNVEYPEFENLTFKLVRESPQGISFSPTLCLTGDYAGKDATLELGVVADQRLVTAHYTNGEIDHITVAIDPIQDYKDRIKQAVDEDGGLSYFPINDLFSTYQRSPYGDKLVPMQYQEKEYIRLDRSKDSWIHTRYIATEPIKYSEAVLQGEIHPTIKIGDVVQRSPLRMGHDDGSLTVLYDTYDGNLVMPGLSVELPFNLPVSKLFSLLDTTQDDTQWRNTIKLLGPIAMQIPAFGLDFKSSSSI